MKSGQAYLRQIHEKDIESYAEHIYQKDAEGYINVLQLKDGQTYNVFNTKVDKVVTVVKRLEGEKDTYITPNTFFIPVRKADNIRHFRALFIDIDLEDRIYSKNEVVGKAYIMADEGLIPRPTMAVDSGRGIHLYWRIRHAPVQAWHTWQELQDHLYHNLKHLGADRKATDAARHLRLPDTINSKNNKACKVLYVENTIYSMYELREQYLNYRPKIYTKKAKRATKRPVRLFNSYTLHMARASDIETICKLRNYDVKGYRNKLLHCYAYWRGIYIRDREALSNKVYELNSKFIEPHSQGEVDTMIRSVDRAIDRFIDYEQGIRSGEDKRISKKMRERGGYWYKNDTLIEMLDITEDEQRHLKTIIGTQEKYRRNNERRRQARRNEAGLTSREQQKQDTIKAVKELREQGLTQTKIAKELGITQGRVSQILNY